MKTVRKIIPVSLYDIPGLESWLEEQAAQGLFPQRLDAWATFVPTGVPGTRFRLEVCGRPGAAPEPDRLELYQAQGWDYAFTVGRAYHLFYTLDPSAPELYSDYESRGMNLEQLERRERRQRILRDLMWAALVLVVVLLLLLRSRFDVQPNSPALIPMLLFYICHPILLILLPLVIFYWRIHRRDARTLRATCRALSMGMPPPSSPGPSRAIQWENRITLALIIPLFLLFLGQWYYLNRWDGIPLSDFRQPYVTLEQLENEPLADFETVAGRAPREPENFARPSFSFLAPIWYEVEQSGYSPSEGDYHGFSPDPEGGNYRYSPSLDQTRLRVLFPALTRPAAESFLEGYRLLNVRMRYEEVDYPGLDFVILACEEGDRVWQLAALGRGRDAAVFRYAGQEDLADHLDTLAEIILA